MLYIFDWDGTLSNSLERISNAIKKSSQDMGLPVRSSAENIATIGLGLSEALLTLYPDLTEDEITQLVQRYRRHYLSMDGAQPSALYDGALGVLEKLKASGHQLAVATGKSRQGLDRILSHMQLTDFFDASRCADETRSKPHPLMLEQILVETSTHPEDSVMVGDTDFDLLMANAAGVKAIGVSYGAHSVDRLMQTQPSRIIDQLDELLW